MNILNATEFFTLKWLKLYFVDFISIIKKKKKHTVKAFINSSHLGDQGSGLSSAIIGDEDG